MKILKHGDLKPRKFVCSKCDCVFVADLTEYSVLLASTDGHCKYYAYCPDCDYYMFNINAPLYTEDTNSILNDKLTNIIDKLDRYIYSNISIYDQDIYINLRNIIGELLDWQEEYKNESNINN